MALKISEQSGGSDFEQLAKGQYNATCYRVIDITVHNQDSVTCKPLVLTPGIPTATAP